MRITNSVILGTLLWAFTASAQTPQAEAVPKPWTPPIGGVPIPEEYRPTTDTKKTNLNKEKTSDEKKEAPVPSKKQAPYKGAFDGFDSEEECRSAEFLEQARNFLIGIPAEYNCDGPI